MRVLLLHPGASWSTADVEAGLRYGLEHHGVEVTQFRLDSRIVHAARWLNSAARQAKKFNPNMPKPSSADIFYWAGIGALERALRQNVDVVLVVSAMYLHPDLIIIMRRAGLKVTVLFTESPYDLQKELPIARIVDGCWTMERSVLEDFRHANDCSGYVPHGWHPARHSNVEEDESLPSHDVVFVGTGFHERIELLSKVDWTGVDFGLYGSWEMLGSRHHLRKYVKGGPVDNVKTAKLYRRAKIGLNLYRHSMGWGRNAPLIQHAESMSPRAYELGAIGKFHLSEYREEVPEVFGRLVPTFYTSGELTDLIHRWLPDEIGRKAIEKLLPTCVDGMSWVERAAMVIGDLEVLLGASRTERVSENVSLSR